MNTFTCKIVQFLVVATLFALPDLVMPDLAMAKTIKSAASVLDGTTLLMKNSGLTIRLFGVEACKPGQRAFFRGVSWPCGAVATGWLTQQTLGFEMTCMTMGDGGYAAYFACCFLPDGSDLAASALTEGMVVATRKDGELIAPEYAPYEIEAKSHHKGLWSSSFELDGRMFRENNNK